MTYPTFLLLVDRFKQEVWDVESVWEDCSISLSRNAHEAPWKMSCFEHIVLVERNSVKTREQDLDDPSGHRELRYKANVGDLGTLARWSS